jgi:hypothetical protein
MVINAKMNKNKQLYRDFCETTIVPVFFQPWWLDAVCGKTNWAVCLVQNKLGNITAVLPYFKTKKWGVSIINQPKLTPHLGVWYADIEVEMPKDKRYSLEMKLMESLISQLPNSSYISFNFSPTITNWLPFFWNNYQATTFYTFQLKGLGNKAQLFQNFKGSVRTEIRNAEKIFTFDKSESIDNFWQLSELTFEHQGLKVPYSKAFFENLDTVLKNKNQRQIYSVKNTSGETVAAAYLLFDSKTVYYLAGGLNRNLDKNCAISFLIWQILQDLPSEIEVFDFEGSMNAKISSRFRSFGGELVPYFHLFKSENKLVEMLLKILK